MQELTKLLAILTLTLAGSACTSLPEAYELPEGAKAAEVEVIADETETKEPEDEAEIPVKRLRLKDVTGGEMSCDFEASPDEVVAALLDFETANGHRAWAPEIEALPAVGETLMTRWHFEGEMGINPVVVLGFRSRPEKTGTLIRFKIMERDFGLAAFFGDYLVLPIPGEPERASFRARMFIDSGVTIANASFDEIAAGLREDARMLGEWLKERRAR